MKKTLIATALAGIIWAPNAASHSQVTPDVWEVTLDNIQTNQVSVSSGGISHIDLVAFYQPINAVLRGEEMLHARIAEKVAVTNEALMDSGIQARVNLVAILPLSGIPDDLGYSSQTNENGDLVTRGAGSLFSVLTLNSAPGHYENDLYTMYGGDLVTQFRPHRPLLDDIDVLGMGSQGGEITTIFDRQPINAGDTYLDRTLAHEIGHNLGAGHEVGAESFATDADAHAYSCGGKGTIMRSTTFSNGDGGKHTLYSNPNVERGGDWCGVAGEADNSAVINRNAPIAAQRRHAPDVLGQVSLVESSLTVRESDGEFTVNLERDGDTSQRAAVGVLLQSGTASSEYDFKDVFQLVEFAPDQSTASVSFGVVSDAIEQGNRDATVTLVYPAALTIGQGETSIQLVDSPAGNHGLIEIEAPRRVAPGDAIDFTLNRVGGLDGELLVQVRTESALGQRDVPYDLMYPVNEDVIFADGQAQMTFSVPVDAATLEHDRGITISASIPALSDAVQTAQVVVDAAAHSYSVDNVTASAGASSMRFTIERSGNTGTQSEVYFTTVDGSLVAGRDYDARSEWVRFAANETSKVVSVNLLGGISSGTLSVSLDTGSTATGSIIQTVNPPTQGEPEGERKGASVSPVTAAFMLLFAAIVTLRRRRAGNYGS